MKGEELDTLFPTLEFENDEDVGKMTLFYFIELAMMGRERKQHMDMSMLNIIDDWESFCNEDWSTLIFQKTLKSLKKTLKGKAESYKEKEDAVRKQVTYSMYGFPHAFQVWAY